MNLSSHAALKPLDLHGPSHGAARSTLAPGDLSHVLTHGNGKRGKSSFSPLLHQAKPATQHEQLIEQTRKWVAQTFFGTMMKQMRNSPFKSKLFEGGRGGEAFGQMYDQRLVEHMSRGVGNKLVNSIVKKIEAKNAKAAYEKQSSLAQHRAALTGGGGRLNADAGGQQGSGNPFPQKKRGAAAANPFQNVRIHVPAGL